jgi:hypothetical protein
MKRKIIKTSSSPTGEALQRVPDFQEFIKSDEQRFTVFERQCKEDILPSQGFSELYGEDAIIYESEWQEKKVCCDGKSECDFACNLTCNEPIKTLLVPKEVVEDSLGASVRQDSSIVVSHHSSAVKKSAKEQLEELIKQHPKEWEDFKEYLKNKNH